jgi:hypothetical protein
MYIYQLDSKVKDDAFLKGEMLDCPAVLSTGKLKDLQPSTRIVIQLSNNSKYKAIIKAVQFAETKTGIVEGFLQIVRA